MDVDFLQSPVLSGSSRRCQRGTQKIEPSVADARDYAFRSPILPIAGGHRTDKRGGAELFDIQYFVGCK